jgi:pantoate kinase
LANHEFDQINRVGIEALSFDDILDISYNFVKNSGLLKDPKTKKLIESLRSSGHHASMIVIGNAVMSTFPFIGSTELSISDTPAHLL